MKREPRHIMYACRLFSNSVKVMTRYKYKYKNVHTMIYFFLCVHDQNLGQTPQKQLEKKGRLTWNEGLTFVDPYDKEEISFSELGARWCVSVSSRWLLHLPKPWYIWVYNNHSSHLSVTAVYNINQIHRYMYH